MYHVVLCCATNPLPASLESSDKRHRHTVIPYGLALRHNCWVLISPKWKSALTNFFSLTFPKLQLLNSFDHPPVGVACGATLHFKISCGCLVLFSPKHDELCSLFSSRDPEVPPMSLLAIPRANGEQDLSICTAPTGKWSGSLATEV